MSLRSSPIARFFAGAMLVLFCGLLLMGCAWLGVPVVRGCLPEGRLPEPETPLAPLNRLVLLGDFGASHEQRNLMVAQALRDFLDHARPANGPTMVLLLGDNFYPRGLVGSDGRCETREAGAPKVRVQLEEVLEPFGFLRDRGIPLLAIAGNHDHGCGALGLENQEHLDRFLPVEQQWRDLWQLSYGAPRAVTIEPVRAQLLLVDSEPMLRNQDTLDSSARALETLMATGRERFSWQIVAAHHPLRTFGTHDGAFPDGLRKPLTFLFFPVHFFAAAGVPPFAALSQEAYSFRYQRYRRTMERVFRRYPGAVDLFVAGHDHNLQLLPPREPGLPVELVVGSGAYCSPVRADQTAAFAAAKHGFAVLDLDETHLRVRLYATSPCTEKAICPVGSGKAYLVYQTVLQHSRAG